MNRFFRSALFPLIVIVLLVYLASQTLMSSERKEKVTYSQLQQRVQDEPDQIQSMSQCSRSCRVGWHAGPSWCRVRRI